MGIYHVDKRYELTKEDVKALRQADESVCFDLIPGADGALSQLRLYRRSKHTDGWTPDTYQKDSYEIPADWDLYDYGAKFTGDTPINTGYASVMVPTQSEHWKSMLKLFKPGDSLKLYWEANGSSPVVKDAGFFYDTCDLAIYRRSRHEQVWSKYVQFQMDYCLTPHSDNRMLRVRHSEYSLA